MLAVIWMRGDYLHGLDVEGETAVAAVGPPFGVPVAPCRAAGLLSLVDTKAAEWWPVGTWYEPLSCKEPEADGSESFPRDGSTGASFPSSRCAVMGEGLDGRGWRPGRLLEVPWQVPLYHFATQGHARIPPCCRWGLNPHARCRWCGE